MGREEGPGVDGEGALLCQAGQAGHEIGTVGIIPEDDAAFESPHHHVVEDTRRIETWLARHA
jgi:hypothetical protein